MAKQRVKIAVGQKYGKLTVIAKTDQRASNHVIWKCRCDCGNIAYVTGTRLIIGSTTSCGCARAHTNRMDLAGQRFGRLVAIKPTDNHLGNSVIWHCQCDCGKTANVAAINLRTGSTKSCGCLSSEIHRISSSAMITERSKYLVEGTDVKNLMRQPGKSNTSGFTGVSWDSSVQIWKAYITFKGHRYFLGSSVDKESVIALRKEAEKRIHGEFLKWYYEKFPEQKIER